MHIENKDKTSIHSGAGLPAVLLFALGVVFYFNTLDNQWALDDDLVYTTNPAVQDGLSGIPSILTTDAYQNLYEELGAEQQLSGGRYRPLSMVTFAIETQFFGNDPRVAHAVNVALYAASLALMFLVLRVLFPPGSPIPFLATFIFGIHPIHTEVVANVKSRDEILSLLFILWTLLLTVRFHDSGRRFLLAGSLVTGFLALLAKEYAVSLLVLPPVALLVFRSVSVGRALRASAVFALPLAAYLFLRGEAVGFESSGVREFLNDPYRLATVEQAWATKIFVLGKYVRLLILPDPLSADYSYNQIAYRSFRSLEVWISVAIHLGMIVVGGIMLARRHWVGFAAAFYLAHIFLVSNLVVEIGATMGERLVYHSSLGFALMVAGILSVLEGGVLSLSRSGARIVTGALLAALAVPAALQTFERNRQWQDDETLFLHDVETVSESALANANAGRAHLVRADAAADSTDRAEHLEKAAGHLRKAVDIHPDYVNAYFMQGVVYDRLRDYERMETSWNEARERFPTHPKFREYDRILAYRLANLASDAVSAGDLGQASSWIDRALHYAPGEAAMWYNRGRVSFLAGDRHEARTAWNRALELNPRFDQARSALESLDREESSGSP